MIEQVFKLTAQNERLTEKVIGDDHIHYMHMIFNKGEGTPTHFTNATYVYMTVVRGRLSINLGDQETAVYEAGTVLKIPFDTKMEATNQHDDQLELIVIKAPAPIAPVKKA
ncbi:MAG: cupin domain-containing protein [Clostridia bacterium]|nr:cupin domain-containing protein [Clostridia bacterium]